MANTDDEQVVRRLDTIIGLLIENMIVSGLITKGRAIEILHETGLRPTDIGKIVEIPTTSVGSILSRQKKQKGSGKKRSGNKGRR